jgi:hypothetical protein
MRPTIRHIAGSGSHDRHDTSTVEAGGSTLAGKVVRRGSGKLAESLVMAKLL